MLRSHQWTLQEYKDGRYSEWLQWARKWILQGVDGHGKKWFECKRCGIQLGSYTNLEECYHDCR